MRRCKYKNNLANDVHSELFFYTKIGIFYIKANKDTIT